MSSDPMNDVPAAAALRAALEQFRADLQHVADADELYALQVRTLGKKGVVTELRKELGSAPAEARKALGQVFNDVKTAIEAELEAWRTTLAERALARELQRFEDLTLPAREERPRGTIHPITATRRALEATFSRLGFAVMHGPHVESERYNFDMLNFRPEHPARDMQDTFFVERPATGATSETRATGENDEDGVVLRTHTSPVQVRSMLGLELPIRVICPGTTFRRDDDATHSPMFHQIEGLCIDRGVTMADLKDTLYRFVSAYFGGELRVRLRPSFFPFVEPGAEFDMQCPFCRDATTGTSRGCSVCKHSGWIELGGAGMVHPNVLEAAGIDPEIWSGWAFGFGIDRMAMLRHDVPDLRSFFEGDIRFLEQFSC